MSARARLYFRQVYITVFWLVNEEHLKNTDPIYLVRGTQQREKEKLWKEWWVIFHYIHEYECNEILATIWLGCAWVCVHTHIHPIHSLTEAHLLREIHYTHSNRLSITASWSATPTHKYN